MLVEAIKASLQESKAAQGSRPEAEPPSGTDDRTTSAASPPAAPLPSPFSSSQQQRPASIQDGIAALNLAHTYKYSPTRQHTSPGKPPIPTAAGDQAVQCSQTDDPGHYRRSFTSPTRSAVILEDESADERADSANERADSASGAHLMTQLADSSLHLPPLWQGSSSMFHRAAPGAAPHPAAAAGAPPGAASPRSPGEGCTLLPGRTNSDKLRSGPHLAASLQVCAACLLLCAHVCGLPQGMFAWSDAPVCIGVSFASFWESRIPFWVHCRTDACTRVELRTCQQLEKTSMQLPIALHQAWYDAISHQARLNASDVICRMSERRRGVTQTHARAGKAPRLCPLQAKLSADQQMARQRGVWTCSAMLLPEALMGACALHASVSRSGPS